jgi:hypothetical protein
MAQRVRGSDLARAIVTSLQEYTEEVTEAIRQEVDDAANDIKAEIARRSPVGATGDYKEGWKVTKGDSKGVTSRVVHNKVYQLPHLLEHGHAKRGGGRVAGTPHIAVSAEPRLEQMLTNIKRIIERGGR